MPSVRLYCASASPLVAVLLLSLAAATHACTVQTAPGPDTPVSSPTSPPPASASPGDAPSSAPGFISCMKEIAVKCDDGLVDGCLVRNATASKGSLTLYHVCVPETETAPSQPCEQEIARQCDAGLVDACLQSPALASTHICVKLPPSP